MTATRLRYALCAALLCAALVVLGRAALPLLNPDPVTQTDAVGASSVVITSAGRAAFWQTDACVPVSWQAEGIRHIYRNNQGTIGVHTEDYCVRDWGNKPLTLRVHFGDNVWRTYRLAVVSLTPRTILYVGGLLALAAAVAFPPHLIPLHTARTPRQFMPYLLPGLLPLGFLVVTNWVSIDFGWHWDEVTLMNQVRRSINLGTVIPDFYNYPSLSFWLMLAALARLPGLAQAEGLLAVIEETEYWHFARVLFLLTSALAVAWTYVLVLVWRRRWPPALLAASALALSWEVTYHLRWIAPDGLLMSFGALTMLFVVTAYLYPARGWLLWGGVAAAGVAVGAKYPGGLLILPVLLVAAGRWWGRPPWWIIGRLAAFGGVFVGAYLITTPGTVFAFGAFWTNVTHELYHYGELGQGYYTVTGGLPHLRELLAYLMLALYSRYAWIAGIFAGLAVAGAAALLRESPRLGLIFLSFPVLYVAYFSTQSVMYVRNMLVTVPFWSVLVALGSVAVWERLRVRPARYAWVGLLVALLAVNAGWQLISARSIGLRGTYYDPAPLLATARANPQTVYWAAGGLYETLAADADTLPPNIRATADNADMIAVTSNDNLLVYDSNYGAYLGRRFDAPWRGVVRQFGPYEVNWNYYPGWDGDSRIVIFPVEYVADFKRQIATPE